MQRFTLRDFATVTNLTILPDLVATDLLTSSISYEYIEGQERDDLVRFMLEVMDTGALSLAGSVNRWDEGWAEILAEYKAHRNPTSLVPHYLRRYHDPVRIYGKYAQCAMHGSGDPAERVFYEAYRHVVFQTYLSSPDAIYEFGSGSGYNLYALAKMFPGKMIVGLDWSQPAVDIANEINKDVKAWVEGCSFDFFKPHGDLVSNSGVLTVGALEQTGDDYRTFIEWLIEQHPSICVHIEPQIDWYYNDSLEDYLGKRFLQVRKYWSGFPAYMHQLQDEGTITILDEWRTMFGSKYVEGYSRFVWRPA